MKVVLLAGGFGSRISEVSIFKLKPMIEKAIIKLTYSQKF